MATAALVPEGEVFNWVRGFKLQRPPLPIKKPFIGEIKPHTKSGVAAGIRQLRGRRCPPGYQKWLVAYEVLAQPMSGRPGRIRVLAYLVAVGGVVGPWDLGQGIIPAKIGFPRVDHPAFFGMAIEPIVGAVFRRSWPSGTTRVRDTGGSRRGPDSIGREVAQFYAELAGETNDPFFGALAAEIASVL